MNVLKKCCVRSLKENRKRTVVTVVGIILSTALITAVACMLVSFRASMIAYEKQENGDFHYHFSRVDAEGLKYFENNVNIERYGLTEEIGSAVLEGSRNPDKPYLYISACDEEAWKALALQLTEGRLPENDSELVIGRHIRSNGGVDIKVGDTLKLQVGDRVTDDGYRLYQSSPWQEGSERLEPSFERTYTVVGIVERPNEEVEPRIAPGYSVFTLLKHPEEAESLDIYANYTKQGLRNAVRVNAGILGVSEDLYERYYGGGEYTEEEMRQIRTVAARVQENYWLLKWELLTFSSNTMNMLYAMSAIAVLVIIISSVFCIRNSFVISLTEKMKLYGMLASVGTTSGQQRRIVHYEAFYLGAAGIPLGILSGIGATVVLVKAVGGMVKDAMHFALIFDTSVPAILGGAVLAAVTVYFSAAGSARRAAGISPVSAVRGNDTVKIRRRELRCPKAVEKLFGVGGKIAYKNLRRARVKYRTTVVSIVVSVAVFIGMSTFVDLMFRASDIYYDSRPYQLSAEIYQWDYYEEAVEISRLDGVQEAEIVRSASVTADPHEVPYTEEWLAIFPNIAEMREEGQTILLRSVGREAYERYCRKVGVDPEEAKDKAIVTAGFRMEERTEDEKIVTREGNIVRFRPGDVIRGYGDTADFEIEVLIQTEETPMYFRNSYGNILLIVSDEWMDQRLAPMIYDNIDVYVKSDDPDGIEEAIKNDMRLQYFSVYNYEALDRADRNMHMVVAIFLYGFIAVVALIGITNIFNTVTTNMELRAPEFAMLRAVGMTGQEFRRMIRLETLFYGGKALMIGIPLGILISAGFHRAFGEGIITDFNLPLRGIGLSVFAVLMLLFGIMHYSMGKNSRKNIVDTIRNENI